MEVVPTMADRSGDVHGHHDQDPRIIPVSTCVVSMADLAPYPSGGNPCSEHWRGPLEPAVSVISGQWVGVLEPLMCPIPWIHM